MTTMYLVLLKYYDGENQYEEFLSYRSDIDNRQEVLTKAIKDVELANKSDTSRHVELIYVKPLKLNQWKVLDHLGII